MGISTIDCVNESDDPKNKDHAWPSLASDRIVDCIKDGICPYHSKKWSMKHVILTTSRVGALECSWPTEILQSMHTYTYSLLPWSRPVGILTTDCVHVNELDNPKTKDHAWPSLAPSRNG